MPGRTYGSRQTKAMCERAAEQRTPSAARENGGCQQLTSSAGVSRTAVVGSWDGQSRNTKHKSRTKRTVNIERGPELNLLCRILSQTPNSTSNQQHPKQPPKRGDGGLVRGMRYERRSKIRISNNTLYENSSRHERRLPLLHVRIGITAGLLVPGLRLLHHHHHNQAGPGERSPGQPQHANSMVKHTAG
ncbi:hypothetical protein BT67DRAFT_439619 [Trichocladium antarcticum]|uniref:Uncharacterized protein n=1 Tax=Trichocladium antarcticum TaxID=1450529 RepID=A0AAN6UPM5_9PEZI|nr:hypothetical protein BT67DRAFT_439619 [Trichocladium antarcticum]